MTDSNSQEDILLAKSGEPHKLIETDVFLLLIKVLIYFIAVPINVFLSIIIIRLHLHSKPRTALLLVIIFSNLLIFVPGLIEAFLDLII